MNTKELPNVPNVGNFLEDKTSINSNRRRPLEFTKSEGMSVTAVLRAKLLSQ
jgi:hypothetical protein